MLPDKKGAIFVIEDAKLTTQTVEFVKQLGAELKINTSVVDDAPPSIIAAHIDQAMDAAVTKIEIIRAGIVTKKAELGSVTKSYDEQMSIATTAQEGLVTLKNEKVRNQSELANKRQELVKVIEDNKQIEEKINQLDVYINSQRAGLDGNIAAIKAKRSALASLRSEYEDLRVKLGKEKLIDIDALDSKVGEVCNIKAEFENALLDEGREYAKQRLKGVLAMAPNRVVAQELLLDVMNYCFKRSEYFDEFPKIAKLESNLKSTEEDLENHGNQKSTLEGMIREGHETVEVLEEEVAEFEGVIEAQEAEVKRQDIIACNIERAIGSTIKLKDRLAGSISDEEINLKTEEAVLEKLSQSLVTTQEEAKHRGRVGVELSTASEVYAEVSSFKVDRSKKSIQVAIVKDANQAQAIKAAFEKDFYIEVVKPEKDVKATTVDALSVSKRFADQQPVNAGEKAQDTKPEVTKVTQLQRLLGYGLLLAERLNDNEKASFGERAGQVLASLNKHLNCGYRLFMCKCPLLRNNSVPFYYLAPLGTSAMAGDSIYNLATNARSVTFKKMDDMVIFPGGEENVGKMFDWKSSKDSWTRLLGNTSRGYAIHA